MYLTKEPLKNNEKAKFVLIKEGAKNLFGMKIFKTIVKMFCNENTNIFIVNYDLSKEDLFSGIDAHKSMEYIEGFKVNPTSEWANNAFSIDILEERLLNFEGVVCINSLTSLLIRDGIEKVYKTLHKILSNHQIQIVALVCEAVHDPYESNLMDRLATTVLRVDSEDGDRMMRSIVHNTSGKVNCLLLEYQISAAFEFTSLVDAKLQAKKKAVQQPDPTANLTFNLRLKDEEVEARNQLQLPYMKTSDEAIVQSLIDNDLYDEEDPDDDLDI